MQLTRNSVPGLATARLGARRVPRLTIISYKNFSLARATPENKVTHGLEPQGTEDNPTTRSLATRLLTHDSAAHAFNRQEEDEALALDEEEYREIFDPTNQVPGNYKDAMSSKTELGNAVREACDELDALRGLETDVIQQAEDLLKGIGFKGSLFDAPGKEDTN